GLATGSIGQKIDVLRDEVDQAFLFAGETDAPDRGRHHLGPAGGNGVEHELAVGIASGAEEQTGAELAAGDDERIGHHNSLAALTGAYDFDVVAGAQLRVRPSRARHNGAIDGYRDAPLASVDRLLLEQRR